MIETEAAYPSQGQYATGVRYMERHCFEHKKYLRFDISKVVTVTEDRFRKQIPADTSNEIEIEIVGTNPSCPKNGHHFNAESMVMKLLDFLRIMHETDCNIEINVTENVN